MTLRDRRYESRAPRRRAGFSILEVMVAVVLMGIGLAGLCPLIVMQNRLAKRIELGTERDELTLKGSYQYQWNEVPTSTTPTPWQDRRLRPTTPFDHDETTTLRENNTFFLVPSSVAWESKLAIGASLRLSGIVLPAANPLYKASVSSFVLRPDPIKPAVSFNVQVTTGS